MSRENTMEIKYERLIQKIFHPIVLYKFHFFCITLHFEKSDVSRRTPSRNYVTNQQKTNHEHVSSKSSK